MVFFYVTFDQIYSDICEHCDSYFSCKNIISVFNLNKKMLCVCVCFFFSLLIAACHIWEQH